MKVFLENQRFKQWWVILLFLFISIMIGYEVVLMFSGRKDVNIDEQIALGISLFIFLLAAVLIFSLNLYTRIDEIGIHYKFSPLQRKMNIITWSNMNRIYVRKYSAIMEYGGWGFRGLIRSKILGIGKHGRAFNVSGNMGIQIEILNDEKILIGTKKPDEVTNVLKNYSDKIHQRV